MTHPRFQWPALLVAMGVLAGCGGSDNDTDAAAPIPATERKSGIFGDKVTLTVGGDPQAAIAPEDFHRHEMKGFQAGSQQSYANASLKLLISAIGPKPLLDHLENYKKTTQNPEESAAAGRFIDLIHKAYNSVARVDTKEFIESLQNLAPFNRRNAAGDWEFKLQSDAFSKEQEPEKFLSLISELFRLDTLTGWAFDIDETYVHEGQERARTGTRNRFQMFQPIQMQGLKPPDTQSSNLQKLVDLLHTDYEAQVKWNEADTGLTTVKVRRQVSIADAENFKRLTISMLDNSPRDTGFSLKNPVTLPALNRKTQQKVLLTLSPKEAIAWTGSRYIIRIKGHDGIWTTHDDVFASLTDPSEQKYIGQLINFAVTAVTPAP